MAITRVVIPAAGLGTRFFPWSKSMPKELLPLGAYPAVAHVAHEAIRSGCTNITMIAGARKHAIIDYFEKAELPASFCYIPQPEPKGLGHAVLMAQQVVQDPFFAVMLPDELFVGDVPCLQQLIAVAERENACVVAVNRVPHESVAAYGVIEIQHELAPGLFEVSQLIEKPKIEKAPSDFALVGRYILPHAIFEHIQATGPGAKGEIQLTDAIAGLLRSGYRVIACEVQGARYDIGNPLGWMKAVIRFGVDHPTYGPEIAQFINEEIMTRVLEQKTQQSVIANRQP
jgi:UTP--glucose-1-phosphate uridylyltransferase